MKINDEAGLLRYIFYFRRCVEAINAKVVYHLEITECASTYL